MDNDAPPEPDARARLTHDQAQELVLRIVSTQAESLLRTAYRNSLCDDDAHDAYQRSMEIFLRRVRTLDPRSAHKWIHVVVKREAQELRRVRSGSVPYEAIDFDLHVASEVSTPEERALSKDRARRAGEALRRLKPQERRAMGLKAFGHSYEDDLGHEAPGSAATLALRYAPPTLGPGILPAPDPTPTPPAPQPPPNPTPRPASKAAPALKITSLRHDERRITVRGTISARASGRVIVRFRTRVNRRTRTLTLHPRIRARRFHATFTLPRSLARARGGTAVVTYAGDADTRPATRQATIRWRD
jgi:DNA-directed RNA polymerase specialized sigma24 family protein